MNDEVLVKVENESKKFCRCLSRVSGTSNDPCGTAWRISPPRWLVEQ